MKLSTSILILLFATGCSINSSAAFPTKHPTSSGSAFGIEKNYIVAVAETNQNLPSTLIVAKSNAHFVLYKKDTSSITICDNLSSSNQCRGTQSISEKDQNTILRVSEKTLWRLLGQETSLKNTTITEETKTPNFLTSDPTKLPTAFKAYFPEMKKETVDHCFTSTASTEKEFVCTWKDITALYQYADTSDIPVSSSRAIFGYTEKTLSLPQLVQIKEALVSELK